MLNTRNVLKANVYISHRPPGVYQICIDNTFSRFTSKLVYLYLVTFVAEQWEKYAKEVQDISFTMENFTVSICIAHGEVLKLFSHKFILHIVFIWFPFLSLLLQYM